MIHLLFLCGTTMAALVPRHPDHHRPEALQVLQDQHHHAEESDTMMMKLNGAMEKVLDKETKTKIKKEKVDDKKEVKVGDGEYLRELVCRGRRAGEFFRLVATAGGCRDVLACTKDKQPQVPKQLNN